MRSQRGGVDIEGGRGRGRTPTTERRTRESHSVWSMWAFSFIYFRSNQPRMMGKLKNKQTENLKQLVISGSSTVFFFSACFLALCLHLSVDTEIGHDQSLCTGPACSYLSARAGSGKVGRLTFPGRTPPPAQTWLSGWASGPGLALHSPRERVTGRCGRLGRT